MVNLKSGLLAFALLITAVLSACKEEKPVNPAPKITAKTVLNLGADTIEPYTGRFTLFSFESGKIVANSDSTTTKWDIGFRGTTIILNGGSSGPGKAEVVIVNGIFDELILAPTSGYQTDSLAPAARTPRAINATAGAGWYNYNFETKIISPIAGKILVFKTALGKYAKMEIVSYYKNKPTNPVISDKFRFYSFRYLYQPDGSNNLK